MECLQGSSRRREFAGGGPQPPAAHPHQAQTPYVRQGCPMTLSHRVRTVTDHTSQLTRLWSPPAAETSLQPEHTPHFPILNPSWATFPKIPHLLPSDPSEKCTHPSECCSTVASSFRVSRVTPSRINFFLSCPQITALLWHSLYPVLSYGYLETVSFPLLAAGLLEGRSLALVTCFLHIGLYPY